MRLVAVAGLLLMGLGLGLVPATAQESPRNDIGKAAGKVTNVEGNTFSLETRRQGSIKVQHDAQTNWRGGAASDIKAGVFVAVIGKKTGGVLHAETVGFMSKLRDTKRARKVHMIRGEVTSLADHTFTLKTPRGNVGVNWGDQTRFVGGTAEDLKVGANIGVAPTPPQRGAAQGGDAPRNIEARAIAFKEGCDRSEPGETEA